MMKFLAFIILMHYLFNYCYCGSLPASQLAEQTLINALLNGYNKNIRPDDQVSVDITATIQQIISIDEKQQIMTSSSFISQTWFDDRLSWTPSSANNIEVVMLPVKSLWIPDTMILNSADTSGYFTISDYSLASVSSDGQVYIILPALTVKTRCDMFVRKFPFDRQVCSINLTSWAQGTNRIAYTENSSLVIDTSEYSENSLWTLNGTDMVVYHAGDRAPFEDTFNDVISIQLYLHRKPLYFMMNGIFACLVLNCVILIAFALPLVLQINICMLLFMTYSVYSLNFSSLFPQQSLYIMTITLFFLLSIGWTLISLAWFVTCNYYTSKGEMPKRLYDFCGYLQRLFFCCFPTAKTDNKTDKNKDTIVENGEFNKSGDQGIFALGTQRRVGVETTDNSADMKPLEVTAYFSANKTMETEKSKCNFCNRCESCQADLDKDKAKGKTKKDIEARYNALNYFVLLCVSVFMFISNMALWLSMSQ